MEPQLPGHGVWPLADPWGTSFTESYMPHWKERAGSRIAGAFFLLLFFQKKERKALFCVLGPWTCALDGVCGDQEWIHRTFHLKSAMACNAKLKIYC